MRTNKVVSSKQVHSGAINMLEKTSNGMLVTGSGDKTLKLLDLSSGLQCIETMKTTDAVFCGQVVNNLAFAG